MSEEAAEPTGPVDQFQLVGTVLDRKFRVERLVAEGGFGIVYYGMHLTLDKPVAVKVLKTPAEFNDKARAQFIEKFALEGKTMARISHPNIVQVLDFGASDMPSGEKAPWMVLEWLTGETLEQVFDSRRASGLGPLTPADGFTLLKPILEALAYAHDEGIAHRDIKPANMMLVKGKRGSTLRLMDFGIAKMMEDGESAGTGVTRTRTSMNAFSPRYAAAEQISGTRTGPWTDVHALALVLVEALTGRPPYDGDDMTTLFSQILSPARPTPRARGFDSGAWEPVLARALSARPDERYHNAGEFLAALQVAVASPGMQAGVVPVGGQGEITAVVQTGGSATGPTAIAPTTLRGSAMVTGVAPVPARSRASVYAIGAAAGFLVVAALVFVFARRSTPTAVSPGIPTPAAVVPPAPAVPSVTPPPVPANPPVARPAQPEQPAADPVVAQPTAPPTPRTTVRTTSSRPGRNGSRPRQRIELE